MSDDSPKRTVRLPFSFGQVVYYRGRSERIAGVVIGFVITETGIRTLVRWTDDLCQIEHVFCELMTEFEAFTEERSHADR